MIRAQITGLDLVLLSLGPAACTLTLSPKPALTSATGQIAPYSGPALKVITLNLAHGRKGGVNQLFLSRSSSQAITLDIISVHLDFSRKKIREQQIEEVVRLLETRGNPTIVMGDFNSDWFADERVIRSMATRRRLLAYRPEAIDLGTYGNNGRRLDWILISRELHFIDYRVLPERLSDHQAVVAIVGLKNQE